MNGSTKCIIAIMCIVDCKVCLQCECEKVLGSSHVWPSEI